MRGGQGWKALWPERSVVEFEALVPEIIMPLDIAGGSPGQRANESDGWMVGLSFTLGISFTEKLSWLSPHKSLCIPN